MERELWSVLMKALHDVKRHRRAGASYTHPHEAIVRTFLWAVLHDRPTSWACDPRHWPREVRPATLPSQPTMSRRLRSPAVQDMLEALGRRLGGSVAAGLRSLIKVVDGKPLMVSAFSADREATRGYGAGQVGRGYKLHLIDGGGAMPACFAVHPLNVGETTAAAAMIPTLTGEGYLLGDGAYDAAKLYEAAAATGHRLVAPRKQPGTGLCTWPVPPIARQDAIATLEAGPWVGSTFGRWLMDLRRSVETTFGNLAGFGGGQCHLPPWVRGLRRVRQYVLAKLLINAARIRRRRE